MTQVLIDRATLEQLVEFLEFHSKYWNGQGAHPMTVVTAGRAALANAEPTGWIAAKDRMPPPQVRVLGFEPQYNIVDVDMWFGPDFNWGYSYWMPLPASPKDKS